MRITILGSGEEIGERKEVSDSPDFYVVTEKMAQASDLIIPTKDGNWIADDLSGRIIGATYGELVDLACKVQTAQVRGELTEEPLDKVGLDAHFSLLAQAIKYAEAAFEESKKDRCPTCGAKKK